jgi:2-oxo-4-hydroxy-4-carboxy-5-ureidoimidazoline decarboxylase
VNAAPAALARFNAATAADAQAALRACCDSPALARAVAAGRPYASADAVVSATAAAFDALGWDDVLAAMAAHPRIGDRASGPSAAEQSGVGDGSRAALAEGNVAYEERFGHVFLICASGLSGTGMLAALRERLGNSPLAERAVATAELRKITILRARKLLTGGS